MCVCGPLLTAPLPVSADRDFEPPCEEDDDEETIDVEEQQEGNDAESQQREIELLKREGELPLEDLLRMLKGPAVITRGPRCAPS